MIKFWGFITGFGAVVVLAFFLGSSLEAKKWEAKMLLSSNIAEKTARQHEYIQSQAYSQVDKKLIIKWEKSNAEKDRIIANLRAGNIRLRHDCAVADSSQQPTRSGQRDDQTASKFSTGDAEFLVRLAADADRNTEQLAACQRLLEVRQGESCGDSICRGVR